MKTIRSGLLAALIALIPYVAHAAGEIIVRPTCEKPIPRAHIPLVPDTGYTVAAVLLPAEAVSIPRGKEGLNYTLEVWFNVSKARRDTNANVRSVQKCTYDAGPTGPPPFEVTRITAGAWIREVGKRYWFTPLPTPTELAGKLFIGTGFRSSPSAPLIRYDNRGKWVHEQSPRGDFWGTILERVAD